MNTKSKKAKRKAPAKKELPLTPRPRNGTPWDWKQRYWNSGERVTVFNPKGKGGPEPGTAGTVTGAKRNRFGRVDYLVKMDGRHKEVPIMLEELLDDCHWPGRGTLLYTGRAAKRMRKEERGE